MPDLADARALADAFAPLNHQDTPDGPSTADRPWAQIGDVEVGVWEISPGVAHDVEVDEVFVVLSGRGEVRFEDGSVIALSAGTVVRLHEGDRTAWTIHETLRKVYVAGA